MKFSSARQCAENVEFYETVSKFKTFETPDVRARYAQTIAAVFLDPDSSMSINIPGEMKARLSQDVEAGNISADLFDAAQREVVALMESDALPRFLASSEFKRVVDAQEEEYKNFKGGEEVSDVQDAFDRLSEMVPAEAYAIREKPSSKRSLAAKGKKLLQALDPNGKANHTHAPSSEAGLLATPETHLRKFSGSSNIRKQLRGIRSWARHRKHNQKHELVSTVDADAETVHTDEETLSGTDVVARYANFERYPIVKEGFLRKMSTSVRKDWKRRWFILRGRCLWYVRDSSCSNVLADGDEEGHLNDPVFVCECAISTVREVRDAGRQEHSFEIISPNRRTFLLQANGSKDMGEWLDALRSGIELALRGVEKAGGGEACADPEVEAIRSMSPMCADCTNTKPEWFSLSLGVLMCIECSGIHRSLGTHISKVRSILLDKPSPSVKALLKALGGNEKVNKSVWEHDLENQTGWVRPRASDSREVKAAFIKSKYQWRGFSRRPSDDSTGALLTAASENDVLGILKAISTGADVKGVSPEDKRTALHAAANAGAVEACELLLQNGGHTLVQMRDGGGLTPTDLALVGNYVDILTLLAERGNDVMKIYY